MPLDFKRGSDEAEKASKSSGGNWSRTHFLDIDDKESVVLRFISDHTDWITVDQHNFVPTKPKPADYPDDSKWPEKMGAVCRNSKLESGVILHVAMGEEEGCYICDHMVGKVQIGKDKLKKPSPRTWAFACIREEVIGDGSEALGGEAMKGKKVGYRDKTRMVKKPKEGAEKGEDGKIAEDDLVEVEEKAIIVVNQGYKNFFGTLKGFAGHFGTICDQDMLVTRSGSDKDTDYNIIPLGQVPVKGGGVLDTRNPEHLKRYGFSSTDEVWEALGGVVAERADLKLYARFWDATKSIDKDGNVVSASAAEQAAATKPSNDSENSPDRLQALAGRIQSYAPPPANGEVPSAATPPEAPSEAGPAPAPAPAEAPVPAAAPAMSGPIDIE